MPSRGPKNVYEETTIKFDIEPEEFPNIFKFEDDGENGEFSIDLKLLRSCIRKKSLAQLDFLQKFDCVLVFKSGKFKFLNLIYFSNI